jgi:hypothetical protein
MSHETSIRTVFGVASLVKVPHNEIPIAGTGEDFVVIACKENEALDMIVYATTYFHGTRQHQCSHYQSSSHFHPIYFVTFRYDGCRDQ